MRSTSLIVCLSWCALLAIGTGCGAGAPLFLDADLSGGVRWDAAPRTTSDGERSLAGGLRYSLQGGSYEAFRDLFTWNATPSVVDFEQAVDQAFAAWTSVDPASGLGTHLSFVSDLGTSVVTANTGDGQFDPAGAEIDLFGTDDAGSWDVGDATPRGEAHYLASPQSVTLTSGTVDNSEFSAAIDGVDIFVNNNPTAVYSLDRFRRILTHEVGHALGLGSAELGEFGLFLDDNFDDTDDTTRLATLTNSWAELVNPSNPANSPLALYTVASDGGGLDLVGVDILMEVENLGIGPTNPITNLVPLSNDDYGTRQFLYPFFHSDQTGDYNGNGVVDAADYTVWRDSLGQSVAMNGDGADGDESGVIDEGDYTFWADRFGNVVLEVGGGSAHLAPGESPGANRTAVPEPTFAMMATIAMLMATLAPRRVVR